MKLKLKLVLIAIIVLFIGGGVGYFFGVYYPNYKEKEEQKEIFKTYYDNKLKLYEEENKKYAEYEVDVAFIGDSLTDGCNLSKYYPGYVTANRGIGGDTTFGVYDRLQVSLYDLQPKVVVMLIGGNNLDTMFENYEDILKGFKENLPNTKIVLASLTAMSKTWQNKNQLASYNNSKIKALSIEYGYEYVDLFTPLFDVDTNGLYENYTTDGAHLTDEGYLVVSKEISKTLNKLLK